jgi:hypothetical protein
VQDGRIAPLELRKFVPLDSLLQLADQPAAQFARLSVVKTPSVPYTHRSVLLIENGNGPGQKASRSWNAAPPRKFAKRSAW